MATSPKLTAEDNVWAQPRCTDCPLRRSRSKSPVDTHSLTVEVDRNALLAQCNASQFDESGFNIFAIPFLSRRAVELLRNRMEAVLCGEYDTGTAPTKAPAGPASSSTGTTAAVDHSNTKKRQTVLHMINISRADAAFRQLVVDPAIGEAVAKATGWQWVRFAQDQVWIKPAQASALSFHRDSPYFDMLPQDVATFWITLDALDGDDYERLGPLEYCAGSHKWGDARTGSANQFFDPNYKALLIKSAQQQGITEPAELTIVKVRAGAGGGSLHNGRTFHGSGKNCTSDQPRRGIGLHYIRGESRFRDGPLGKLWEPLRSAPDSTALSEQYFPTVYKRDA